MDANFDIKFYRERWKAVEEIETFMPDDSGRRRYNLVKRFLICFGILQDNEVDHMQIILRWAKLKNLYEQKQLEQLQ
jgi:hypothetical protein